MTNTKIDSEAKRVAEEIVHLANLGGNLHVNDILPDLKTLATASRESGYELRDKEYAETLQGVVDKAHAEGFAAAIAEVREKLPKEKDITLNEVGSVGDYHTHGYNEYHDAALNLLNTLPASKE